MIKNDQNQNKTKWEKSFFLFNGMPDTLTESYLVQKSTAMEQNYCFMSDGKVSLGETPNTNVK